MGSLESTLADPERHEWDAIVVGCGMGGGTVGYELSRLGNRVLFLEKGRLLHGREERADSERAPHAGLTAEAEARLSQGRWPLRLRGRTTFGDADFFAPLGCGSAGSTSIYGAQLERFRPSDFEPRQCFPDAEDAALPEAWPVSHAEMIPYYRRAEELFRVCGTQDPLDSDPEASLRPPPPLSKRDQVVFDSFRALGLHPYRSHVGFAYDGKCAECSEICACKSDAGNRCVVPAIRSHGARILPGCEVLCLLSEGRRVTGVRARWKDRDLTLRARTVIVAAGAYMTPALLINSRSHEWPDGLANRSGLVGRYLMLHTTDFLVVDPGEWHPADGPRKALALNDFYNDDGQKLGTLQSAGFPIEAWFAEAYLRFAAQRDPTAWGARSQRTMDRAARIAEQVFRAATLMVTIVEDLPYAHNRIVVDRGSSNGMRFEYTYTDELKQRNKRFRQRIAEVLAPRLQTRVIAFGDNNINYGHVCGTCRFGDDPTESVLDRNNRAHGLDNLYVVDASFFPSSGGTNPSLTIAANALRVAGVIHAQL